jgi:hypothetical protein
MSVAVRKGTTLAAKSSRQVRCVMHRGKPSERGVPAFGSASARWRWPVVGMLNANPYGDLAGVVEPRF